jgi:YhgE/Pip-like protein
MTGALDSINRGRSQVNDPSAPATRAGATPVQVRAGQVLKRPAVWIPPITLSSIMVILLTVFYIGSLVNPLGHLRGLPVAVVNADHGATVGSRRVDIGQSVQAGLTHAPAVATPLALTTTTLRSAEQEMDRDGYYATVLIPAHFTGSLLALAGVAPSGARYARPEIVILTNNRAGSQGVGLATGILQPALAAASGQIGRQLTSVAPAAASTPVSRAFLANPVTVTTMPYRPLPSHNALGLSAFYVALLTLLSGFLGGAIANSSADVALGYASSEVGTRWRQRRPVPVNRWHTLLIKWAMAPVLAGVATGFMLIVAVGILRMDAPHVAQLWLLVWLAATSVAVGVIVLFAVFGLSLGQLLALLLFVYAGLASAGGTVPLQALPTVLRWLAQVEPLRQILSGTRAILYFNARGDAGLARSVIAAAAGLVVWLLVGTIVVRWYDRKGLTRMNPQLLAYVHVSADEYRAQQAGPGGPGDREPPAHPGQA